MRRFEDMDIVLSLLFDHVKRFSFFNSSSHVMKNRVAIPKFDGLSYHDGGSVRRKDTIRLIHSDLFSRWIKVLTDDANNVNKCPLKRIIFMTTRSFLTLPGCSLARCNPAPKLIVL